MWKDLHIWDNLYVFYHVAKEGSFTKAAQNFRLNQSSFSRTLMNLEYRLGYRLFTRKSRMIKLTPEGEEIFKVAELMVSSLNLAKKNIEESKGASGTLRLYLSAAAREYLLSRGVLDFKRLYPDISLEIICKEKIDDMILNNIDIAILPKIEDEGNKYEQKPLINLKPKLFCSSKYIEKFGVIKSAADLAAHSYVIYGSEGKRPCLNQLWFWELNETLREKNVVLISNSKEDVLQACREGHGIMSSFADEEYLTDLGLRSLPIESKKQSAEYLIIPKSHANLQKIQKFEEFLNKQMSFEV